MYCEAVGRARRDKTPKKNYFTFQTIFGIILGRAERTLEWKSFTTHTLRFFFFFFCGTNAERGGGGGRAQPLSERGERRSVRGIFCLADFHLQSGDVTFVCGNEIAWQQTVDYIILLPSSLPYFLPSFPFFFCHLLSPAPETSLSPGIT